ncbi:UDP-3-O-acyl-N-acetylglucosamine deacetylase [Marivivens sp. LCG002]|uniref:UDP-3-O-acyl-N-acetylglucosamine deacetylase n=1 Tax=Marivivens sp. LCG002 TaxID=3051171 RepID=UPI002556DCAB|nr:UDP-3-O-acyl-N-acetylglucosamine deacetylase [Marivivens sp. LCG002]WIV51661.1 UDP-3-O-acyl-N-acetylglucosamine deacetylase [Marivivens sp. LCG002]
MQTSLQSQVTFKGIGLHSGIPVAMTVRPAPADTGIVFRRIDVTGDNEIAALWSNVSQEALNTRIVNAEGVSVATIEHIMAALSGCGVHNAFIDIDGPEVPIMDGSSAEFVAAFVKIGLVELEAPLRAIEILREVKVTRGEAVAVLRPSSELYMSFSIEFPDPAIGAQTKAMSLANGAFVRELCNSRTFCRNSDVEAMRKAGLALGGSLENAVVVDGESVLTPGGLRHGNEAVRHKMLDALGDLFTAGAPIIGAYEGVRAGHALTNALLREVFSDPRNYRLVTCAPWQVARLPGAGLSALDLMAVA